MKKEDYYSSSRPEIAKYISLGTGKILDVGCGDGLFLAEISKDKTIETWGIELNEKSALKAQKVLNKVFIGDATKLCDKLPDNYFDCIVCNDILEHLVEPDKLLINLKSKLKSGGVLIASIPNIRFFPVLEELIIKKNFAYAEYGVMDETHLRFFTKKSIRELFVKLDFKVVSLEGINMTKKFKYQLVNALFLNSFEDSFFQQFVISVRLRHSTEA